MSVEVFATLACVLAVVSILATNRVPADLVLVGGMVALQLAGVLSIEQALVGFSNTNVLVIALLYVVVAGLRETGAISWISLRVFGHPRSVLSAQMRLALAPSLVSPFMNNTPLVALLIPVAQEWSRRLGIAASKLLMPMNNQTVLAGLCSLIGTSTNLVVDGLLQESSAGASRLGLFEIAWVGVPLTLIGLLYILFVGRRLLPDRQGAIEQLENAREYSFEIHVQASGPIVGRTIAEVGLRSMRNAYLLEIERDGRLHTAVGPGEVLRANDRLICVGVVDAIKDLRRLPGLLVAEEQAFRLDLASRRRCLVEIVLAPSSPMIGQTVRDARFRSVYNAAIIAVCRSGTRIPGKIGDIQLEPGDTLLVEADGEFAERHRYNRDFLLVSPLQDSVAPDFRRAPLAVAIAAAMVAANALELISLFGSVATAAALMLLTRCVSVPVARGSIEYQVVIAIAASFALGAALQQSGAAALLAQGITDLSAGDAFVSFALVYLATVLLTELVTNTACAVVMFPIALAAAAQSGASHLPFVIGVMVAASSGFMTPFGYQTNMMIYGPGGYRFGDYVRYGLPLTVLIGIATLIIVPRVWEF